jgi:putative phage-type endonuclease
MFQELCETMKGIEEIHPLPTHPSYFDDWASDIQSFMEIPGEPLPSEWYSLLSLRKRIFEASFTSVVVPPSTDAWKWLLTVDQMPQRTTDWYSQKRNMLTASEISNLWKGPRSRINLIASKCVVSEPTSKRLATLRKDTNPMDWGVRYEPIVKGILERGGGEIQELGRIQHRTIEGLAASPDGLYVAGSLRGSLVEIKCPVTRIIEDKIPFEYWCQMQIQMEVCDIDTCEYVEAKFNEGDATASAAAVEGYISLCITKDDTDDMKYVYHTSPTCIPDDSWLCIETYSWACTSMRRTMVKRDTEWFARMQPDIALFWKEVADVREGRRILEPVKKKKTDTVEPYAIYSFIDD